MFKRILDTSIHVGREVLDEMKADYVPDLAAGVTFFIVFALPAGILALISTLGFTDQFLGEDLAADAQEYAIDFIDESFGGAEALKQTVEALFTQQRPGLMSLGLLVALWALAKGFAGLIRALDIVYDLEETRGFLALKIVAIVSSIALLLGIGVTLFAVSAGLPPILLLPAIVAAFATLYHTAPSHMTPWRSDLPGAIFTSIGWILLLRGFGFYLRVTKGGNSVLGTVAAGLAFLTLLYFLNMILLIGGELNAVLTQRGTASTTTASLVDSGEEDGTSQTTSTP